MVLEEILEGNQAFVQSREPKPLPPPETLQFAVVSCYDPRLDELIRPALGLSMGSSILLRTAGAVVGAGSDPLRSLGLAVFLFGVTDVLVVGHTSCRMAKFDTSLFIDAFRKRGVPREAFGVDDLRSWAAAIPDPKRSVKASVAVIRSTPFLPKDVSVAGFVLDDTTGALEVVVRPDEAIGDAPSMTAPTPAAPQPTPAAPEPAAQDARPRIPQSGMATAAEAAVELPPIDPELAQALRGVGAFVQTLEGKAAWQESLARLRESIEHERNPIRQVASIEAFIKKAAANSRDVLSAFDKLKNETASAHGRIAHGNVIDLFRPRAGQEPR